MTYVLSTEAQRVIREAGKRVAEKLAARSDLTAVVEQFIARPATAPSRANDYAGDPGVMVRVVASRETGVSAGAALYQYGDARTATTAIDELGTVAADWLAEDSDPWEIESALRAAAGGI